MTPKASAALIAALLAAAGLAAWVLLPRPHSAKSAALDTRQRALDLLGVAIARLHPGCKVLVLANPFTKNAGMLSEGRQYERASLSGLRHGLGARAPLKVGFPEIRSDYQVNPQAVFVPPDSRTPVSYVIQPASVDQLAEANPECSVIVSLIGLPPGVDRLKTWDANDSHCFALLLPDLRPLGSPTQAAEAFNRGKLLAAVVQDLKSGAPLVVTRENILEVLEQQPGVFGY